MIIDDLDAQNLERIKVIDITESEYEAQAKDEYTIAYKAAKLAVIAFLLKHGKNGKLTPDAYKYGRFEKLTKELSSIISGIKKDTPKAVSSYLKTQYTDNLLRSAYAMETQYGKKLGIKELSRSSIDPLTELSKTSLKSNKTILKNNLNKALSQSIARGEGVNGVSSRIKTTLERNLNSVLATTRTETTQAVNDSSISAMAKAAKVIPIKKEWVAIIDSDTRDSHRRIDGEVREVGKRFSNGLMYPGDPAGSAAEVINCRCRLAEVVEGFKTAEAYRSIEGVDAGVVFDTYEEWARNRL